MSTATRAARPPTPRVDGPDVLSIAPPAGGGVPFAALPHHIAGDPRLKPVDVRILLALLFWAHDKATCWPCDASIGKRVGRCAGTVQRRLRKIAALGDLLAREEVEPSDVNRTGRVLRLLWVNWVDDGGTKKRARGQSKAREGSRAFDHPGSSASARQRIRRGEEERPSSDLGSGSPPPPAGDGGEGEAPPSAEELARWRAWAEGPDRILGPIARRRLAELGIAVGPEPVAVEAPAVALGPEPVAVAPVPEAAVAAVEAAAVAPVPSRSPRDLGARLAGSMTMPPRRAAAPPRVESGGSGLPAPERSEFDQAWKDALLAKAQARRVASGAGPPPEVPAAGWVRRLAGWARRLADRRPVPGVDDRRRTQAAGHPY